MPDHSSRSTSRDAALPGGIDPMIKTGERRGRNTIIVDEWGPVRLEVAEAVAVPATQTTTPLKLRVLGPAGTWKVEVRPRRHRRTVRRARRRRDRRSHRAPDAVTDYDVALEYRGASVTSPRGAVTKAGAPLTLSAIPGSSAPADWTVRFFEYTDDLRSREAAGRRSPSCLRGTPLKTVKTRSPRLHVGPSDRGRRAARPVRLRGRRTVNLPPGNYTLQVISDDGARVWVDDKLVLDAWDAARVESGPRAACRRTRTRSRCNTSKLAAGRKCAWTSSHQDGQVIESSDRPADLDRARHADVSRDRARRRQRHLHLDPVGQAARGPAAARAADRAARRDGHARAAAVLAGLDHPA